MLRAVPGTGLRYYLISFDKHGVERADDPDGRMSDLIVRAVREDGITDVFLTSHGWKGDVPAAIEQYDLWIGAMASCAADRAEVRQRRPGFAPLIIGFHWPSQPWGDEEFGGGGSFAAPGIAGAGEHPAIARIVESYGDRIADTPKALAALRTIAVAALSAVPGTTALPPHVADAYRILNEEAQLGGDGPTGGPASDREPFDPDKAYARERDAATRPGAPSFGGGGGFNISGILSPLRQLSFWKMKDRARTVGESAGFSLLERVMKAAPTKKEVNVHLMGHSFGCIVVASMAHGPEGQGSLPKPVASMTLVQGATSLWGFCDDVLETGTPGYFRNIIARNLVSGSILTTRSIRDTAVGHFYPLGAGMARQTHMAPGAFPNYGGLGSFGIQGAGLTLHDLPIESPSHRYDFQGNGHVYNLECSTVIKDGGGASGAHSDIAKPEVAHAMWEAVKTAP